MKRFAELYARLDETTKTTGKVAAMVDYFAHSSPADAMWAVYFLSGRKPRQVVAIRRLQAWALELSGVPEWLFEECYQHVGDMAETIAQLLPPAEADSDEPLTHWILERLLPLRHASEEEQKQSIVSAWRQLDAPQRFLWNKLLTGSFRVGVSQSLVVRALAQAAGLEPDTIAHRLMGEWEPTPEFYESLLSADAQEAARSRPYPFFLAHPLEKGVESLGELSDWQVEWKWDGIRSQVIQRGGESFVWSRGEELVTDRYPELAAIAARLPDGTVLDGEILPWKDGAVLPFAELQRRIGRKTVGKKLLAEVPVVLMAYDILEVDGVDLRELPLTERRAKLEAIAEGVSESLLLSQAIMAESWDALAIQRQTSRELRVEGLMLKRLMSPYRVGRVRGDWWKWKLEPLSVDAVLIYAQPGHGKRSGLFTDYTFGVWDGDKLVPFAKAYSGLTDAEIRQVDAFVRANATEKFGPVRTVKPELVFELGFEGIQTSSRHKSGVAVRFPRMLRWRHDKTAAEADTLNAVKALMTRGGS